MWVASTGYGRDAARPLDRRTTGAQGAAAPAPAMDPSPGLLKASPPTRRNTRYSVLPMILARAPRVPVPMGIHGAPSAMRAEPRCLRMKASPSSQSVMGRTFAKAVLRFFLLQQLEQTLRTPRSGRLQAVIRRSRPALTQRTTPRSGEP
jgi:hypothetical protein